MMLPTMQLRFVKRRVGRNVVRILQQQWMDEEPPDEGAIKLEWRDVPLALDFDTLEPTKPTFPSKAP